MPLYSIPAEQSVLGELISHPDNFDDAITVITESDFYRSDHRAIFKAMKSLKDKGHGIDPITVESRLSIDLEEGYLDKLQKRPSGLKLNDHLHLIHEFSFKRNLLSNCNSMADFIESNESASSDELVSMTQSQINASLDHAIGKEDTAFSYKDMTKEFLVKLREQAESGDIITGLASGFKELDEMTAGLQPADMIVWAARPSMGKTASAMNVVENVCLNGGRAMVFSLEMPKEQLLRRSFASIGRIDQNNLKTGRLTHLETANLAQAVEDLNDFDIIIDDEGGLTLAKLRARAIRAHRERKLDLIMIDYLQLMKGEEKPGGNRTNEISDISRGIKLLAKELGIPIIVLSQLNRSLEQRPNKRPINSDLRESGAIEQDADLIVFVYRDEVYNEDTPDKGIGELIIGKHRNGALGTVKLRFTGNQSRFDNLAKVESVNPESLRQPMETQTETNHTNSMPF